MWISWPMELRFILVVSIILPFMQVITISMSPASVVNKTGFHLIPTQFDFSGYTKIASDENFWHSYMVTIIRAIAGTASGVLVTLLTAYPLAKTNLPYRKGLMIFVVFTMYFSGGMIPKYLLIKNLHLTNNFLVYILPCLITGFALIITRNFFMSLPPALEESAKIDGATNMQVLFQDLSAFIHSGYCYHFPLVLRTALELLDGQYALCNKKQSLCFAVCDSDHFDQWSDSGYGDDDRCHCAYRNHEDGGACTVFNPYCMYLSLPSEVLCKRYDGRFCKRITYA